MLRQPEDPTATEASVTDRDTATKAFPRERAAIGARQSQAALSWASDSKRSTAGARGTRPPCTRTRQPQLPGQSRYIDQDTHTPRRPRKKHSRAFPGATQSTPTRDAHTANPTTGTCIRDSMTYPVRGGVLRHATKQVSCRRRRALDPRGLSVRSGARGRGGGAYRAAPGSTREYPDRRKEPELEVAARRSRRAREKLAALFEDRKGQC